MRTDTFGVWSATMEIVNASLMPTPASFEKAWPTPALLEGISRSSTQCSIGFAGRRPHGRNTHFLLASQCTGDFLFEDQRFASFNREHIDA